MRKALREGKHVTLASDGHVYVSRDAGTPMTEAQEAFIESKLGHVIELARSGYGVGVKPDGSIFADRADHLSKVMYDPDPQLSEQQRLLLRQGVSEGALVQIHADGRLEYFRARDAVAPPADQVTRLQAAIDDQIASGRLLTEMGKGFSLSANPDGSLDYRRVAPGPEPGALPGGPGRPRHGRRVRSARLRRWSLAQVLRASVPSRTSSTASERRSRVATRRPASAPPRRVLRVRPNFRLTTPGSGATNWPRSRTRPGARPTRRGLPATRRLPRKPPNLPRPSP